MGRSIYAGTWAACTGAGTVCLFHKAGLNTEGIKLLARGALQGAASFAAIVALEKLVAFLEDKSFVHEDSGNNVRCLAYGIGTVLAALVSKVVLDRLGGSISYREAFTTSLVANANAASAWILQN